MASGIYTQNPSEFRCTKDSPVDPPIWSTTKPRVEMRHIFCGEIVRVSKYIKHKDVKLTFTSKPFVKGFHSISSATNYADCAVPQQCKSFPNGNAYCKTIFVYDSSDKTYEIKFGGSTLWPESYSPAQLVPMFQYLYNTCNPPADTDSETAASLCFSDCHWKGDVNNGFDIVIATKGGNIVTAYPAQQETCSKHPDWQDCDGKYCQELLQ